VIVPPLQVRMVTCSFLERAFKGRVEQTSRTQKTYHGTSRGSAIFSSNSKSDANAIEAGKSNNWFA
jgi:hypothetical protein